MDKETKLLIAHSILKLDLISRDLQAQLDEVNKLRWRLWNEKTKADIDTGVLPTASTSRSPAQD